MTAETPYISRYQIEKVILKAKKTKSGVPDDMPKIIHKEFGPELSIPLSRIYNKIIKTGQWPEGWKVEFGLTLKKTPQPKSEDDMRLISLTPFFQQNF